jgi:hypothetical protein
MKSARNAARKQITVRSLIREYHGSKVTQTKNPIIPTLRHPSFIADPQAHNTRNLAPSTPIHEASKQAEMKSHKRPAISSPVASGFPFPLSKVQKPARSSLPAR